MNHALIQQLFKDSRVPSKAEMIFNCKNFEEMIAPRNPSLKAPEQAGLKNGFQWKNF